MTNSEFCIHSNYKNISFNMTSVLLLAALTCVIVMVEGAQLCSNLTKTVDDGRISVQKYGDQWRLVKSNMGDLDRCMNFKYYGKPDNATYAEATLINRVANFTVFGWATINPEMNQWNFTAPGMPVISYRKLFIDIVKLIWCIYSCDLKDDTIDSFRCLAIDDAGKKAIDELLEKLKDDLPFKVNGEPKDVWSTNCEKSSN